MPNPVLSPPAALNLRFTYDRRVHGFRDTRTGKIVAWQTVRGVLDNVLESARQDMRRLSASLQNGQITLAQWQMQMQQEVKRVHLASYAIQRGGWQNLTQSDYGRIGRLLYNPNATSDRNTWGQYQFLRQFVRDIESGKQRLDGTLLVRADLYTLAGRHTYHRAERLWAADQGFTQERSLLNPADHCTDADGPHGGCVEEEAKLWQPLGEATPVGERNCHANCKCSMEYRNEQTGATWPSSSFAPTGT